MPTEPYERGLGGEKPGVLDTLLQSEQGLKDMERGYKDHLGNKAIAEAVADELERRADEKKNSSYDSDSSSPSSSAPAGLTDMVLGFIGILVIGVPVAAIVAIAPAFVVWTVVEVVFGKAAGRAAAEPALLISMAVIYVAFICWCLTTTGKDRG